MNKYQEAFAKVLDAFEHNKLTELENFNILNELVGKTTPMKPFKRKELMVNYIIGTCPTCGCGVDNNLIRLDDNKITFCTNCGQAIDWGED